MWKYTGKKECNEFLLSLNLFNCSDNNKYLKTLYAISNNIEDNYHIYKIKKRNGKFRTIYEPTPLLKQIQKQILNNILSTRSISKYATAYHKGISLKDNALPHQNKEIVLKLDIENFFENISFIDIYKTAFPIEYFPESIGVLLTNLCTYDNHLTQGSVTSPYISNLVMKKFDEDIGSWCRKYNITYTRYSDDMTFSGLFTTSDIIKLVKKKLAILGLKLNVNKTHVINKSKAQLVTGITVNKKVQVPSKYRKKIRQTMYYIKKYGLSSHLSKCNIHISREKYLKKLYGQILYILQINSNDLEFQKYKNELNILIYSCATENC